MTGLLLAVLWTAKDALAEFFLARMVRQTTGFVITVDKVDLGVLNASLKLEGVKVFNPASVRDTFVADIPLIYFDCELFDLIKGTIYLRDLTIHINELVIVKEASGLSNFEVFSEMFRSSGNAASQEKTLPVPEVLQIASAPKFKIGIFEFVLKKIIYKRYPAGGDPRSFEITANYQERLTNVTSIEGLLRPLGFLAVNKLFPMSGSVAAQSGSDQQSSGTSGEPSLSPSPQPVLPGQVDPEKSQGSQTKELPLNPEPAVGQKSSGGTTE